MDESISESESIELVKMTIIDEYTSESYSDEEVVRKRQTDIIEAKGLAEDIAALETIAKILVTVGQDVIPILIDTVNSRQLQSPLTRRLKDTTSFHIRNILEG